VELFELGGVSIPAGSAVMPVLGAANRQKDRRADPDRFDIFRSPTSLPVLFAAA
jgi:cytochrome P450